MRVDCRCHRRNGWHVRAEEAEMTFGRGNGVRGDERMLGMSGHTMMVLRMRLATGGWRPPQMRKFMQSCRK